MQRYIQKFYYSLCLLVVSGSAWAQEGAMTLTTCDPMKECCPDPQKGVYCLTEDPLMLVVMFVFPLLVTVIGGVFLPKKFEADTITTKRDPRMEKMFGLALAVFLGILTFIVTTIGIHSWIPRGWDIILGILAFLGFLFLGIAWFSRK